MTWKCCNRSADSDIVSLDALSSSTNNSGIGAAPLLVDDTTALIRGPSSSDGVPQRVLGGVTGVRGGGKGGDWAAGKLGSIEEGPNEDSSSASSLEGERGAAAAAAAKSAPQDRIAENGEEAPAGGASVGSGAGGGGEVLSTGAVVSPDASVDADSSDDCDDGSSCSSGLVVAGREGEEAGGFPRQQKTTAAASPSPLPQQQLREDLLLPAIETPPRAASDGGAGALVPYDGGGERGGRDDSAVESVGSPPLILGGSGGGGDGTGVGDGPSSSTSLELYQFSASPILVDDDLMDMDAAHAADLFHMEQDLGSDAGDDDDGGGDGGDDDDDDDDGSSSSRGFDGGFLVLPQLHPELYPPAAVPRSPWAVPEDGDDDDVFDSDVGATEPSTELSSDAGGAASAAAAGATTTLALPHQAGGEVMVLNVSAVTEADLDTEGEETDDDDNDDGRRLLLDIGAGSSDGKSSGSGGSAAVFLIEGPPALEAGRGGGRSRGGADNDDDDTTAHSSFDFSVAFSSVFSSEGGANGDGYDTDDTRRFANKDMKMAGKIRRKIRRRDRAIAELKANQILLAEEAARGGREKVAVAMWYQSLLTDVVRQKEREYRTEATELRKERDTLARDVEERDLWLADMVRERDKLREDVRKQKSAAKSYRSIVQKLAVKEEERVGQMAEAHRREVQELRAELDERERLIADLMVGKEGVLDATSPMDDSLDQEEGSPQRTVRAVSMDDDEQRAGGRGRRGVSAGPDESVDETADSEVCEDASSDPYGWSRATESRATYDSGLVTSDDEMTADDPHGGTGAFPGYEAETPLARIRRERRRRLLHLQCAAEEDVVDEISLGFVGDEEGVDTVEEEGEGESDGDDAPVAAVAVAVSSSSPVATAAAAAVASPPSAQRAGSETAEARSAPHGEDGISRATAIAAMAAMTARGDEASRAGTEGAGGSAASVGEPSSTRAPHLGLDASVDSSLPPSSRSAMQPDNHDASTGNNIEMHQRYCEMISELQAGYIEQSKKQEAIIAARERAERRVAELEEERKAFEEEIVTTRREYEALVAELKASRARLCRELEEHLEEKDKEIEELTKANAAQAKSLQAAREAADRLSAQQARAEEEQMQEFGRLHEMYTSELAELRQSHREEAVQLRRNEADATAELERCKVVVEDLRVKLSGRTSQYATF